MHTFNIICCFSRSVRSNGQVGLGKVDKHRVLVWYRHVRLSILHFCIRFCIFLHRAHFSFWDLIRPWAFRIPFIYGSAHALQSVSVRLSQIQAKYFVISRPEEANDLGLLIICCPGLGSVVSFMIM